MGAQWIDKVFRVEEGQVADEEEEYSDGDDSGFGESYTMYPEDRETGEFADCADGYYWQWRRIRSVGEIIGMAIGPLHGPFATEELAQADRKAAPDPFKASL